MFRGLKNRVFVEFGSGTGRLLSEVAIRLRPRFAIGIDISRAMVEGEHVKAREYCSLHGLWASE